MIAIVRNGLNRSCGDVRDAAAALSLVDEGLSPVLKIEKKSNFLAFSVLIKLCAPQASQLSIFYGEPVMLLYLEGLYKYTLLR